MDRQTLIDSSDIIWYPDADQHFVGYAKAPREINAHLDPISVAAWFGSDGGFRGGAGPGLARGVFFVAVDPVDQTARNLSF